MYKRKDMHIQKRKMSGWIQDLAVHMTDDLPGADCC